LTDQHSYRSEDPLLRPEAKPLSSDAFPDFIPEEAVAILDAGRDYDNGHPPDVIHLGNAEIPNFRKTSPPQTILGQEQKKWLLDQLRKSKATWKLWGDTEGTLEWRADLQNLPPELNKAWAGGYANMASQDHSNAFVERAEIYDFVRAQGITGFGVVAGDRHSFWAGLAASALPPGRFDPVGVVFIAGSVSAVGLVEAYEHALPKDHPLHSLYIAHPKGEAKPQPVVNMLMRHGVRSALEYARTGDIETARRLSNPDLSPHLAFLDLASHGYAIVRASAEQLECEFVCIERPIERAERADGGPLRYRVVHRTSIWESGEQPVLTQEFIEGSAELSV
jgi:alkaline phosphatase D